MSGTGPQDDWNDDDHYPMHPAHPGWDDRPEWVTRLQRLLPWIWVVLGGVLGVALLVRWWTG